MENSYILKAEGKPSLFSYDIGTELKYIEKWVNDSNESNKEIVHKQAQLLKQIAIDFIEIIQTKKLTIQHCEHFKAAIIEGKSGAWEIGTSKLEVLAYHFDLAKETIIEIVNHSNSKIIERGLTMLNDAFSTEEQIELLKITFNSKSKKIKLKSAEIALETRNKELIPFLNTLLLEESNLDVIESIQFAIDNMWQAKGELVF